MAHDLGGAGDHQLETAPRRSAYINVYSMVSYCKPITCIYVLVVQLAPACH